MYECVVIKGNRKNGNEPIAIEINFSFNDLNRYYSFEFSSLFFSLDSCILLDFSFIAMIIPFDSSFFLYIPILRFFSQLASLPFRIYCLPLFLSSFNSIQIFSLSVFFYFKYILAERVHIINTNEMLKKKKMFVCAQNVNNRHDHQKR